MKKFDTNLGAVAMRCDEFERELQRLADGSAVEADDVTMREHAQSCVSFNPEPTATAFDDVAMREHTQSCHACHELEEGFRLVVQAFAASRIPEPATGLSDRIVSAALRDRVTRPRAAGSVLKLAVAAGLLCAISLWGWQQNARNGHDPSIAERPPAPSSNSPPAAPGELLFPELANPNMVDSRDGVVLVEAVEPVSEIFRAVGRSLGSPIRPIAGLTTEALENLFKDLPDADSTMMLMPGMREIMPMPTKKKAGNSS